MDTSSLHTETAKHMGALEGWLAPIFAKFPHIPMGGRQTLVQIVPWLALIFGVLGIFGVLSAGSLVSYLSFSVLGMGMLQISMFVSLLIGLAASLLEVLAFRPLKARRKKGWNFLFYATVLTTASAIFSLLFGYSSLNGLIGSLIGFWLLFEVRGLYQ